MAKTNTNSPRKGQNVGYIRVSTTHQNTDRQLADIELDEEFTDKKSGKNTERPALQRCIQYCRTGDTLHVHSIDRLARDLRDLEALVGEFTNKGVAVKFHKENLSFSGEDSPMDRLLLQMLGAVAQFERSIINERIRDGIEARKAKGLPVGAKRKLNDQQISEIKERCDKGEEKKALAFEFGVSRQTLYRALEA